MSLELILVHGKLIEYPSITVDFVVHNQFRNTVVQKKINNEFNFLAHYYCQTISLHARQKYTE
jgi:hypothetical protein